MRDRKHMRDKHVEKLGVLFGERVVSSQDGLKQTLRNINAIVGLSGEEL